MATVRRLSSSATRSGIPLPVALLAAALLLIVPVTARAGGEVPHVHALAHLLVDGQDARLDHHHRHDHDVAGRVTGSADAAPPPPAKAKWTRAATVTRTDVQTVAPAIAAVYAALSVITLPDTAWFHQGGSIWLSAWSAEDVPATWTDLPESPPPRLDA